MQSARAILQGIGTHQGPTISEKCRVRNATSCSVPVMSSEKMSWNSSFSLRCEGLPDGVCPWGENGLCRRSLYAPPESPIPSAAVIGVAGLLRMLLSGTLRARSKAVLSTTGRSVAPWACIRCIGSLRTGSVEAASAPFAGEGT